MKCPNCGHEQPDGATECLCCQVIFEKWLRSHAAPAGSPVQPTASTKQPPFFYGLACMTWSLNRLYRIYIRPGELFFIWAASGSESERIMGRQFGLAGAISTALTTTNEEQNALQQQKLDKSRPEDLLGDHESNFRAAREDFLEASLESRSLWLHMVYAQITHKGVFRFNHREKGKFALCLQSEEDVEIASRHLATALGDKLRVDIKR